MAETYTCAVPLTTRPRAVVAARLEDDGRGGRCTAPTAPPVVVPARQRVETETFAPDGAR